MCTYLTARVDIQGSSGKGALGWMPLNRATVSFDHPFHAEDEHTLNIDFTGTGAGPAARIAVELTLERARALVSSVQRIIEQAEAAGHT